MRYTKLIEALYRVTANKEIVYVVDCRHDMDMLKRANGAVYMYEGNYYYLRTNFFQGVVDQIQDKIRFIKNKDIDFYFRCTDNKDEINLAKTKKIKPSLNFRDNYREKGLSVSQHPHYHGQYKYIYVVKGDEIAVGSDGEPVLDIDTIQVISPLYTSLPRKWIVEKEKRQIKSLRNAGLNEKASALFEGIGMPNIELKEIEKLPSDFKSKGACLFLT